MNVIVNAKPQVMLALMQVSRLQELAILRPGMVDITFCWECLSMTPRESSL
jgi:hypothetical protein